MKIGKVTCWVLRIPFTFPLVKETQYALANFVETIMPDQPGPHWAKLLDIQMLTMHTGRERTRAEYATLLAEEKFRLERVIETRSDVQILEAIPA